MSCKLLFSDCFRLNGHRYEAVALDWSSRNLYWIDAGFKEVKVLIKRVLPVSGGVQFFCQPVLLQKFNFQPVLFQLMVQVQTAMLSCSLI